MNSLTIAMLVSLIAGSSLGAGFQLYTEGSAEALALGGAVSARTNLLSAAWYNPAALVGADSPEIMVGNTFIDLDTDFDGNFFNASMERHWRSAPHLYYVHPISKYLTGTLSINAPYGLITEWPTGWGGSATAIKTELETAYLTPSLAYKLTDKLSASVGFNIVRGDAEMTRAIAPGDILKMTGDDVGYGYMLSTHYRVNSDWSLGARYQSRVKLTLDGDMKDSMGMVEDMDAKTDITLPRSFNIGLANNTFEKWTLSADLLWTEWSTYKTLVLDPEVGPSTVINKDWRNVWSARFGAEYDLSENWVLRGGYVWDESPVNGDTRGPEMPGSDRNMFMLGCGYEKENWGVDLAYSYLTSKRANSGPDVDPTGDYETSANLVSMSVSYKF